jgi:hypothetical protein
MQFIARNGRISLGARGDGNTELITYQISPLGKNKLTIADKYLFGKYLLEKEKEKETAHGRFIIDKISPTVIAQRKLDDDKVGYVDFYKEKSDELGEYDYPPLVHFRVFVSEDQFQKIKQGLLYKLPIAYLKCVTTGFYYGDPDSSEAIWNLKEGETEISHRSLADISIQNFNIGFGNPFDDEYHEGLEGSRI